MDDKKLTSDVSKMSLDDLIGATEKLYIENSIRQQALDALKDYGNGVVLKGLSNGDAEPPDVSAWSSGIVGGMPIPSITAGSTVFYNKMPVVATQTVFSGMLDHVDTEERRAQDRRLQLKLFVHFAKLFVEKYPQWKLMPEPEDPFGKVKLVRPDIGASIVSLYPMNELAVYGGPDLWMSGLRELGQVLPIVKVFPQTFFGWALDIDTPEWVR